MTVFRKGLYLELINRSTSRIVFSAATDQVDRETFDTLWHSVGGLVYEGRAEKGEEDRISYYELRVSPIT